ncbi:hypothetical protein ABZS29_20095 [Kribbella sp. NPDC005582]|uniref:hypothetical protein n=1 Tax=Kribbella sp. NPDC005582 TaxID=3156893 RepID=UPI0033AA03C5
MHGQEAREFARIAAALTDQVEVKDIVSTLAALAALCVRSEHLGLILRTGADRPVEAGSTDLAVAEADHLQVVLGEGPSWPCLTGTLPFLVGDLESAARWPNWHSHVAVLGFRRYAAARLSAAGATLGVLTIYSEARSGLVSSWESSVQLLATHASRAITLASLGGSGW